MEHKQIKDYAQDASILLLKLNKNILLNHCLKIMRRYIKYNKLIKIDAFNAIKELDYWV
jgi:hypothetical protein